MFIHFSCIRTLFSIYLLYLNCFRTFLIVSLSLLLFLFMLVVSMAPKHKSTSSQNPLHSGASFSSKSTPSHLQFHDKDVQKDFSENFSRRGVHSKHRVIPANFVDTDLPTVIHSRGWEVLCDIPVTCPSVLIQEFYSNMHGFNFSVPLFSTYIPRVEHPNYPDCERLRTMSKDEMISAFCEHPTDWGDH